MHICFQDGLKRPPNVQNDVTKARVNDYKL